MRKLLPILLALLGLGGGVGAGLMLRPPPAESVAINPCGETTGNLSDTATADDLAMTRQDEGEAEAPTKEYVKLNNQFIVPIVGTGVVKALVIMSISLEVKAGSTENVYLLEPKLRDSFLQVLFDHANSGGFKGSFTDGSNMVVLRRALLETATATMGDMVKDVLIVEIVRQDG